jgi:hypothetical protein
MRRILFSVFGGMFFGALICSNVWAQATAQISGTVRDQSGAVLPGVEVTATQTETGISRTAITNETGSYIVPNLAIGPYRLEAALPGFRTFAQTGIVLQVNSNPAVNPVLEIGQVTEAVEVQANAALVETRSTAVGQVIENERILELPLNGRKVTDLIALSGAAVQTGVSPSQSWQGGALISIAGGQSFGVGYSLDGAMHSNPYDGSQMPLPFPDALQEFKVEASGISANGGSKSGGAVTAVTKSGTNEFHGDAFEFVRNYKFNARNFFARSRDTLKRNQFGGTLGGPIVKNKLFFFGGYQATKERSDPGQTIAYVPTAAMLAGDWTTFASAACNSGGPVTLRAPFANNRIDPALYSKAALNIAGRLPPAQDECGKVTYGLVQKPDDSQTIGKIDYEWSSTHSSFGRIMVATFDIPMPYTLTKNILTTTTNGYDNLAQSYAIGDTHLIGPTIVNAARLAVNRTGIHRTASPYFGPADVGVNSYSALPGFMVLNIFGGFNLSDTGAPGPGDFVTTAIQAGNDLSVVRGNHQMAFGANIAHWRTIQRAHRASLGNFVFNGSATNLGMGDFLTGRLTTLNHGSPTSWASRQTSFGAYAQDVWKHSPKLTLSYGLRWEPFLPLHLTEGAVYNFDYDRFHNGIRSTAIPNAPVGLYFPGDPGFPKNAPINVRWTDLAPRVGLAWDPHGDGRTSVRASYGIAYDFSGSNSLNGSASSPPYSFNVIIQSPVGGFEDPWRGFPGGMPLPWVVDRKNARFTPYASFYAAEKYDMKAPGVQSWNLSIQRQLPGSFLVSGTYLGSHTTHLWVQKPVNNSIYFAGGPCTLNGVVYPTCSVTGNSDQRRRLILENPQEGQSFSYITVNEDGGTGNYNGLLLSVQRQAARGVNVSTNYTWAHCIGNNWNVGGPGTNPYPNPNDRDFEIGNCASDRRHLFNFSAVAETPQFANRALRVIGSAWRLAGIYRWSAGTPLTITTGLDRALNGTASTQRPNQVLGNPYGDRSSVSNYLNPNAFAQPSLGTLGNMRPFNVVGPSTFQFDVALSRGFKIRERQSMEFRAEAFNVTNSFRIANTIPAAFTTLNNNTFGQINFSADARIMQFALKYAF